MMRIISSIDSFFSRLTGAVVLWSLLLGCLVAFGIVSFFRSTYAIRELIPSPKGTHTALVYVDSGGGTAGWSDYKVVVPPMIPPEVQFCVLAHRPIVRWTDDTHLEIFIQPQLEPTHLVQIGRLGDGTEIHCKLTQLDASEFKNRY
jgi:hypothetical protein